MKIVVVMPAYNAGKTIEDVFRRLPKKAAEKISEYVIVDDGSADDTYEKAKKLAGEYNIKIERHGKNRGYGGAQKTGFNRALKDGAEVVVLLHSDGQYAPEMIEDMWNPVLDGDADVVGGSRMLGGKALEGGMPLTKYLGNRFLTIIENLVLGLKMGTYHSGYKVYSRKALDEIPFNNYSNKFTFDNEMLMGSSRVKLKVVEVPIPTRYADEKSYLNSITYGIDTLLLIFKYIRGGI